MNGNDDFPAPLLGGRFQSALNHAVELHARQARKGTRIPYVSHLLAVCALVLEAGGDEDQAIAALLHDAVEDQGGAPVLAEIRARFGDRVADIVAACSDTDEVPKPPWQQRKEAYIAHLAEADADAVLVSLADKTHNLRSILLDYLQIGDDLWARFNAGRDNILWYYRELLRVFNSRRREISPRLLHEYAMQLEALEKAIESA